MSDDLPSTRQLVLPKDTQVSYVFQQGDLVLKCGASTLVIQLNHFQDGALKSFLDNISSASTSGDQTLSTYRDPQSPQPLPVKNDLPLSHNLLISEIEKRRDFGAKKYGQALQAENGRNAVQDALEEVIDAAVYLINERTEQRNLLKVLNILLDRFSIEDRIYDVRDRADLTNFSGNSWDHPDVTAFSEAIEYLKKVRDRLRLIHGSE